MPRPFLRALNQEDRPDPESLLLSPRPDIVAMVEERLRLMAGRKTLAAAEVHDMLLDVRNAARRQELAST